VPVVADVAASIYTDKATGALVPDATVGKLHADLKRAEADLKAQQDKKPPDESAIKSALERVPASRSRSAQIALAAIAAALDEAEASLK
jgi:hypothetical protein